MSVSLARFAPTLLLHALIGSLVGLILLTPPPGQPSPLPSVFWLKQAVVFGLLVALFYANVGLAVPRLLYRRQALAYLALAAAAVLAVLWVHYRLDVALQVPRVLAQAREDALNINPWCAPRPHMPPGPESEAQLFNLPVFVTTLLVLGVGTSVAAVQKNQRDAHLRQQLEQARMATELSLLKAQINPHFFFNTLNNIYSLTLIDGARARTALHRLSRMMRYVLYETPAQTALLSQEITFLRDYIDLMHLRLTDDVTVTLQVPEPLHDAPIAPMLLLPYVENAFKHGVRAGQRSRVHVALRQPGPAADVLEFEVCNSLFPKRNDPLEEGGIGLSNTRRRLELLYPGQYRLAVQECTPDQEYCVRLTLHLRGPGLPPTNPA